MNPLLTKQTEGLLEKEAFSIFKQFMFHLYVE